MTPVVHVGGVLNAETSMQLVCQSLGRWGRFMLTGIAGLPNQGLYEKWICPTTQAHLAGDRVGYNCLIAEITTTMSLADIF